VKSVYESTIHCIKNMKLCARFVVRKYVFVDSVHMWIGCILHVFYRHRKHIGSNRHHMALSARLADGSVL
jgi:hypothetical protein